MKYPAAVLAAVFMTAAAAAPAPEIEPARVDAAVARILQEGDLHDNQTAQPDGKALRAEVLRRLQTLEILKNAAFKAGLDKDPQVQSEWKTAEAEFYAGRYVRHLEDAADIDEAQLKRFYDRQTRMIQLHQVGFATREEADAALSLLRKGLSFDELMKRFPNPDQRFDGFVMQNDLSPAVAPVLGDMVRGEVTHEPVAIDGRFFLFKINAVQRNPEAQPFELVRSQIARQLKQEKAQAAVIRLLEENGIKP